MVVPFHRGNHHLAYFLGAVALNIWRYHLKSFLHHFRRHHELRKKVLTLFKLVAHDGHARKHAIVNGRIRVDTGLHSFFSCFHYGIEIQINYALF